MTGIIEMKIFAEFIIEFVFRLHGLSYNSLSRAALDAIFARSVNGNWTTRGGRVMVGACTPARHALRHSR